MGYAQDVWVVLWANMCLLMWKYRCQGLHDPSFVWPLKPWEVAQRFIDQYRQAKNGINTIQKPIHVQSGIRWWPPPSCWVRLNTNEAAKGGSDLAGCGEILRDEHGRWMGGFSLNMGYSSGFLAEFRGAYQELTVAKSRAGALMRLNCIWSGSLSPW